MNSKLGIKRTIVALGALTVGLITVPPAFSASKRNRRFTVRRLPTSGGAGPGSGVTPGRSIPAVCRRSRPEPRSYRHCKCP